MDLTKVKRLRRALTLHFAIIAWLTAMLVATGSGSVFLPVFIFFVSVSAFVFVDTLEWFELGRIGSYIGMLAATGVAISSYLYSTFYISSESGQLLAVAGLLVYPEAVLFLQRKNLRIFEQLAVFLLLEMIVAALVNDNLLFGLLLAPIMLLWVSSLFLFSRYSTLVYLDPAIEIPNPKLAEVLFKRFVKHVLGDSKKTRLVSTQLLATADYQSSWARRRALQSIPIGVGALIFSGLFFYLLPRTFTGSFQTGISSSRQVGLPSTLTFGSFGRILQNGTPVMRVSIKGNFDGKNYPVESPPYLRSMVFDTYSNSSGRFPNSTGEWQFGGTLRPSTLRTNDRIRDLTIYDRDLVTLEFDIKRQYASAMYTVPPIFRVSQGADSSSQEVQLFYDPLLMLLQKLDESNLPGGKSVVYQIGSAAFARNEQTPVTPARLTFRSNDRSGNDGELRHEEVEEILPLKRGFYALDRVNAYRVDLLQRANVGSEELGDKFCLAAAKVFENHLTNSGEFTYSLDLSPPSDVGVDPVEDFLLNQKSGHCQYFASAMVAMLRQTDIPSRIVVGYRPKEYNSYGKYFLVRQSDAHAWVEGLFERKELIGTPYEQWLTDSDEYWVRFDPTPSAGGDEVEIVEQKGQAMDFAEKLWKDYVVDGQKLGGTNSLYAPVAENSKSVLDDISDRFNRIRDGLQRGRSLSGQINIAWSVTFLVIGLGVFALAIWQLVVQLPRLAPRLAKRLGVSKNELDLRHQFFARCLKMLERMGIQRDAATTPLEFTEDANQLLSEKGQPVDDSLGFLTSLYYQMRFGGKQQPTREERTQIDQQLRKIEIAISSAKR